jgi:hypothetical protein
MDTSPRQLTLPAWAFSFDPINSTTTAPNIHQIPHAKYLFFMQYFWADTVIISTSSRIPLSTTHYSITVGQSISISSSRPVHSVHHKIETLISFTSRNRLESGHIIPSTHRPEEGETIPYLVLCMDCLQSHRRRVYGLTSSKCDCPYHSIFIQSRSSDSFSTSLSACQCNEYAASDKNDMASNISRARLVIWTASGRYTELD